MSAAAFSERLAHATAALGGTKDASAIAATLAEFYMEICRAPSDPRVVQAWTKAIVNGSKTIDDFVESLVRRPEYRVSVESRFRQMADEMVGSFRAQDFEALFDASNGGVVRDVDIKNFIRSLPAFRQKYQDLVQKVSSVLRPSSISDSDARAAEAEFVERFCAPGSTYEIESLHADMLARYETARTLVGTLESSGPAAAAEGLQNLHDRTSRIDSDGPRDDVLRRAAAPLQEFECAFGRKMFVEEYLWHGWHADVQQLRRDFLAAYHLAREVYVSFADARDFSEYDFVRKHLAEYQLPDFIEALPQRLLYTPEYEARMKDKLSNVYKNIYGESLESDGLDYLFASVRELGMGVHDEELPRRVQAFKAESETIIENVYDVYTETLVRPPEADELAALLREYRTRIHDAQDPVTRVNAELCVRLIGTLEFHDVIKDKLRAGYARGHNATTSQGSTLAATLLYGMLQRVLAALPQCRNMQDVDEAVDRAVLPVTA